MRKVNWEEVKTEYITGEDSLRTLCTKYKVSWPTFQKYSKGWANERKEYRKKLCRKAIQKTCDKEANAMAEILTASRKLAKKAAEFINDDDQFNRYIVTEMEQGSSFTGEKIFKKADAKAMAEFAKVLSMAEKLERTILDMQTEAEKQHLEIERERWELEKQKAQMDQDQNKEIIVKFVDPEGWED